MPQKNYIKTDGNNNIVLQDINGQNININDISTIKKAFENSQPAYLKELFEQIDQKFNQLTEANKKQTDQIVALLQTELKNKGVEIKESKNILTGTISGVGGNVQLGDTIIYNNTENNSIKIMIALLAIALLTIGFFVLKPYFSDKQKSKTSGIDTTQQVTGIDTSTTSKPNIKPIVDKKTVVIPQPVEKLKLSITTNNGNNPVFEENDKVLIKYKLNKPAYVRIIYLMADSSAVLLADNLYVEAKNINTYIQTPYNFVCAEPFGTEKLVAYAQAVPFEKLNTKIQYGYEFITQSIYSAYEASEKGLKKDIEFAKKVITVTTKSKNE